MGDIVIDIKNQVPEQISLVLETLQRYGYEAYLVGGCVRDLIMNERRCYGSITTYDYDVTTNASPQQIIDSFPDNRVILTGIKHGTVTVVCGEFRVEVTTYRIDGDYLLHRKPAQVEFATELSADLVRRDFTMNALACDLNGHVIDICGGICDIHDGIIRAVGDPVLRFSEDALRILRALRFSARLGFNIDEYTEKAMYLHKNLLQSISIERVRNEFDGILLSQSCGAVVARHYEILAMAIPEIGQTKSWSEIVARIDSLECSIPLRLAYLLSDLEVSRISEIIKCMKYDNRTINAVQVLSNNRAYKFVVSSYEVKRLLQLVGVELSKLLLQLWYAQGFITGEQGSDIEKMVECVIQNNECYTLKQLCVNGDDLIRMGIKDGKYIKEVLCYLLDKVIADCTKNDKLQLMTVIKAYIKKYE